MALNCTYRDLPVNFILIVTHNQRAGNVCLLFPARQGGYLDFKLGVEFGMGVCYIDH